PRPERPALRQHGRRAALSAFAEATADRRSLGEGWSGPPKSRAAREQLFSGIARRLRSHRRHVARASGAGAGGGRLDRACAADGGVGRARRVMRLRRVLTESGAAGVLGGLLAVSLIFGALIGPQFFRAANVELMARQTVIVAVAALGMTMIIVSGGIDLSVGSVVALSTVVVALMLRAGTGPALAAAGAVAAGALCGALTGLLLT